MEAAIAWLFLYKYARTSQRKNVVEIFIGIFASCGADFWRDESKLLHALLEERSIRERQFELIRASGRTTRKLLDECLG